MHTTRLGISFSWRCLSHASHIYNFPSNGWYNSAVRMWYCSCLNNLTLRWYRLRWYIVQIYYGPCFACWRKLSTLLHLFFFLVPLFLIFLINSGFSWYFLFLLLLFHFLLRIFMISILFIYQLHLRIFLIPCFLIFNI